jgi:hypothetical protein
MSPQSKNGKVVMRPVAKYSPSFLITAAFVLTTSLSNSGCQSSSSSTGDAVPSWTHQTTRTVDNGYIVYIESDDDQSRDRAKFKAESSALADLANECTFIPKGVRIEDRYDGKVGGIYQAYAKVGVEFQVCEEAKKASNPETIRKLANAPMNEQVKSFQEMIGQKEESITEADEGASTEEQTEAATDGEVKPPAAVRDDAHFFVIRERIFYAKRDVILSQPGTYAPLSPESIALEHRIAAPSAAVAGYEAQHPELMKAPRAWSSVRHDILHVKHSTGKAPKVKAPKPRAAVPAKAKTRRKRRR